MRYPKWVALRYRGFRSENRYIVFQLLPQTVGLTNVEWRVLDTAHKKRNHTESEGSSDIDHHARLATP